MALNVPLTPGRRVILAAGVPAALLLIAFLVFQWGRSAIKVLANGDQRGYPVAVSAPLSGGQSQLTVNNADISLQPGGGSRIRVRGSLYGAITPPTFQHQETRQGLLLNPTCAAPVGNCSLTLHARVPATLPVTATDTGGNLSATGLTGNEALSDNSGNLTATGLGGSIYLNDQFGELNASGLSGGVQIVSTSGDITASGVTGNTRLQDNFGNITVTGLAAADVRASDVNGDILLVFTKIPRHVAVTDTFGNITLELPRGPVTYRVQAPRPLFGTRSITVPESPSSHNVITAHNSNGDITISNR
ncbi:MAG TPA: DUF4097 family beta strand repeat-containing protein [Streptosporangiaceae bacterium]|jgi:hypothetical protein|nr:DUF4097 family beta strand repeat-containing protein [Streptosporangiaceae bacterium]